MKKLFLFAILAAISSAASAQMACTTYPNGQVICVPIGGGQSSYR